MEYVLQQPHPLLRPFVHSIWIISGHDYSTQRVVCDGFAELIFHFGAPYSIFHNNHWQNQERSLVAGQIDESVLLRPSGLSEVIGVKFFPSSLWKLFGWNMHELKNRVVPLRAVLGSSVNSLEQALNEAFTRNQRIRCIETFLLQRVNTAPVVSVVDKIVQHFNSNDGEMSVRTVANDFNVTVRRIERMFHEQVGVSPKVFSRIIRFKKVYSLLEQSRWSTAEVSQLCGYFDQPHMNKEFKKFSGMAPDKYFAGDHAFGKFLMAPLG